MFSISWVQSLTTTTRSPVTGATPGRRTRLGSCCCRCPDSHGLWCWSLGARIMCAFCLLISSLLGPEAQLLQPGARFNVHWALPPLYFPCHPSSDEQVCGLCSTLLPWAKLFLFTGCRWKKREAALHYFVKEKSVLGCEMELEKETETKRYSCLKPICFVSPLE